MATARQDKTRTKPGPAKIPAVSDNTRLSLRSPEAAFPYGLDMLNPGASVREMRRMKSPLLSTIGNMLPVSGQEILTEAAIGGAMGPAMAVVPGAGHLLRNLLDLPRELKFFKALLKKVKDFPAHLEGRILIFKAQDVQKIAKALDDPKVGNVPESFTTDLKIFDKVSTDATEASREFSRARGSFPLRYDDEYRSEAEEFYKANDAIKRMQKSTMTAEKQAAISKDYVGREVDAIQLRTPSSNAGQRVFHEKSFPQVGYYSRSDPLRLGNYRSQATFEGSIDYEKWLKKNDPKLHKKMQDAFGDDVKNWMVGGGPGPPPPIPRREGGTWPDVTRLDDPRPLIPSVSEATKRSISPKPIRRFEDDPEGPMRPRP